MAAGSGTGANGGLSSLGVDGDGDEEPRPTVRTPSASFSPLVQRHSGAYDDGCELDDAGSGSPFRGGVGEEPLKARQLRLFRKVHLLKRKWLELQMNANEFSQSLNTLLEVRVAAPTRVQ